MKLISFAIPCYNSQEYMAHAIESILTGGDEVEIIVVNDGSKDDTSKIGHEYAEKYPDIVKVIDKENGGHGSAWNVGVKEATGKYLRFLDSDDWLTNLDLLMKKLQDCEADLVFTNEEVYYAEENRSERQFCSNVYDKVIDIKDVEILEVLKDRNAINFRKCTYLTHIIQQQYPLFREKVSYDDTILYAAPFKYATKYIAYNFVVYNLLRGRDEQSMNPKVLQKKADQLLIAYIDLQNYIAMMDYMPTLENILRINEKSSFLYVISIITQLPYRRRKELINSLIDNVPNNISFSKQLKRYKRWPFIFAYMYDEMRYLKQNKHRR
jgi:glycosyltransferase involved in cell wall biosynthesis